MRSSGQLKQVADGVEGEGIVLNVVLPLPLVLFPQQVLVHVSALAQLLLVLVLTGDETKHNLLDNARVGDGSHARGNLRLLAVSHLDKGFVDFLLSKSCLVEEGKVQKILTGKSLVRALGL